ncbi:hypothetical protein ACF0H5_018377 [Mactra antiquata]
MGTSTCRDRLGYFRPNDFKVSSCAMCYIYLVIDNPQYVLYPTLAVQTFHHRPYGIKSKTKSQAYIIYPDFNNSTTVNTICRELDDVTCSRWITCCEDAWACCKQQLLQSKPVDGEIYCPQTFDGWDCWNFTEANTTVTQVCPSFLTRTTSTYFCNLGNHRQ